MTLYQDINAETIDRWIAEGWEWGRPIGHETFERARRGEWDVLLTPTKAVPHSWFGELRGKRVLGLASGGGQQMPLFAAQGALVPLVGKGMSPLPALGDPAVDRRGVQILIFHAGQSLFLFSDT